MNRFIKIISCLVLTAMLMTAAGCAARSSPPPSPPAWPTDRSVYHEVETNRRLADAGSLLYDSFYNGQGQVVYPANYGGHYIDGEQLIICLNGLSEEDTAPYRALLKEYEAELTFRRVRLPYRQLLEAMDEVRATLESRGVTVYGAGTDDAANCVYVWIEFSTLHRLRLPALWLVGKRTKVVYPRGFSVPVVLEPGAIFQV